MAARYRLSHWRRLLNTLARILLLVGLGPQHTSRLPVQGQRTGTWDSTPVTLVEDSTHRWLVGPDGEVSGRRNARAAGQVTLSRRRSNMVAMVELGPGGSAPVLQQDGTEVPITRPFFDAKPESPLEAFVSEAPRHPVLRICGGIGSHLRPTLCLRAYQTDSRV